MHQLFKALSDPTRRRILEMLRDKDLSAGEIASAFDISKPSISHHLDALSRARLITGYREGQFIRYSLNTNVFDELMAWLISFNEGKAPKGNTENK